MVGMIVVEITIKRKQRNDNSDIGIFNGSALLGIGGTICFCICRILCKVMDRLLVCKEVKEMIW